MPGRFFLPIRSALDWHPCQLAAKPRYIGKAATIAHCRSRIENRAHVRDIGAVLLHLAQNPPSLPTSSAEILLRLTTSLQIIRIHQRFSLDELWRRQRSSIPPPEPVTEPLFQVREV